MDIAKSVQKGRRFVASLSVVTMVASMLVSNVAHAAVYQDVPENAWFYSYVEQLAADGILDTTKANYNPADLANRAEAAKMLVQAAGMTLETPDTPSFKDVGKSAWYYSVVETAAKNGVVGGYKNAAGDLTGNFGPADPVTREQFSKMAYNALAVPKNLDGAPNFPDVAADRWSSEFVETLYNNSVVDGYPDGTFGPEKKINRAEIAKMVVNSQHPTPRTGGGTTPPPGPTSGDLNASLAASSPKASTIPSNATSVPLLTFNLMAPSSDVTVNDITILKTGVSTLSADFQGYLYDGNNRLTSGKSVNSTSHTLTFTNLGWKVAKGSTSALTLRADMGDMVSTGDAMFAVTAIASSAKSVAGLPVSSATFQLSTVDVGTVTISKNGAVAADPKVGEKGVEIAKFKIEANGIEDANVSQIGLIIDGSVAASDVGNLKLWSSGQDTTKDTPLAVAAGTNAKDIAAFVLANPYKIEKSGTKSFSVTADFNTGRNNDTVHVYLDEKTDFISTGGLYGAGMTVVSTLYDDSAADGTDASYSTVKGGDVTISSSGPAATDIAVNAKAVKLLSFNVTSLSKITIDTFGVGLIAAGQEATSASAGLQKDSDDTPNFTNIKIIDTKSGAVVESGVDSTAFKTGSLTGVAIGDANDDAQAFYLYNDDIEMAAGESRDFALIADVANNTALNNETLIASLQLGTTYPEIKGTDGKKITNSSQLVPASVITGKTMTVKTAGLTLSLAANPSTKTWVKGSKDVPFAGLTFRCETGSDCKVTALTLTAAFDNNGGANGFETDGSTGGVSTNSIVGSVWLKDAATGGNLLAASKSVQSNGTVVFSNLNWTIKAGDSVTAYVRGDISTNAFESTNAEDIAFEIASTSNVTAEDKDGNSISSITGTVNTVPTTYVTTSAGGSLTIAVDADTAKENIVVAGTAGNAISKYKFTSTDEAFVVKKLSINNRQSAATTAALGNYDNNVTAIKLSYTNSAGVLETKIGTLSNGTSIFSGLDMPVPADGNSVLSVSADLSTFPTSATAGEFVDLNLAFNNFEATAQGSGETYKSDKLDATVDAASDLDFGTITWTDGTNLDINTASPITVGAAGTSVTLTVNDEADGNPPNLPVGTLLCQDTSTTCSFASKSAFVVTSWTEGTTFTDAGNTGDTVVATVINDVDTAVADADNLVYSLPGSGYLTAANQMVVYESKPTITTTAGSPSGVRAVATDDQNVFLFTIAADPKGEVDLRAGVAMNDTIVDGIGGSAICTIATTTTAGLQLDGTAAKCTVQNDDNLDSFAWSTTGTDLSAYARVNFWIKQVEGAGGAPIWSTPDLAVRTTTAAATSIGGQVTNLTQADCGSATTTMVTNTWYNCDVAMPTSTSANLFFHIQVVDDTRMADTDVIYVDQLKFYNEKLAINVSTDGDVDTYANNVTNAGSPAKALLKFAGDGSTLAEGYFSSTTNGASATALATATFIPTTEINIPMGGSKNFTLTNLDSQSLINQDDGDDAVTFQIPLGTSSSGTVTNGNFFWYETNATVKWLGQVANTTLNSNTLIY